MCAVFQAEQNDPALEIAADPYNHCGGRVLIKLYEGKLSPQEFKRRDTTSSHLTVTATSGMSQKTRNSQRDTDIHSPPREATSRPSNHFKLH